MEECFGQVGREVHLADGQVEIFFVALSNRRGLNFAALKCPYLALI